jgi:hypothetical protein
VGSTRLHLQVADLHLDVLDVCLRNRQTGRRIDSNRGKGEEGGHSGRCESAPQWEMAHCGDLPQFGWSGWNTFASGVHVNNFVSICWRRW